VKRKEHPQHHHHVSHAEDIGSRPAGGDGEDVAEEGKTCVVNRIGVRERVRAHVEPGGGERPARRRHHAAVGDDGNQIEKPAERNHPQEAQIQIPHDARSHQRVGGEMQDPVQTGVALGHHGDEHHLHPER